MEILIKAAQLLLSLSILVILHEFGHFIPARIFKIRVEKFYLFFDPWFALVKKKVKDTEWGIGWLPLGGYVKLSGMVDESMDKEQLALPPKPDEFRSKPAWQRLIVMCGGVIVNIILGFIIYIGISAYYGDEIITNEGLKSGYGVNALAEKYGFRDGDKILKIEGENIKDANPSVVLRGVLLRKKRVFTVQHANGLQETLTFPKDIDRTMFAAGMIDIFTFRTNAVITTVDPKKPAAAAQIKPNDVVVGINGKAVNHWDEFTQVVKGNKDKVVTIDLMRNGQKLTTKVRTTKEGIIGVASNDKKTIDGILKNSIKVKYSFGESISAGFSKAYWTLNDYVSQLKFIFTKKGATELGGFGSMGKLFASEWNWEVFWNSTALISIILAFMNILPIPALDGGHVLFLLYEIITRRPAPQKLLEYAQIGGFILLMSLMLYANGNDIYKAIFN